MKKSVLQLLFVSMMVPAVANAGFLVAEDATYEQAPAASRKAPPRSTEVRYAEPQPARIVGRKVISGDESEAAFGQVRTFIRHKGRKPAVFGKPVTSQSDTTLATLVVDVLPEQFQAFASGNVDMTTPVKGGKAQNWVAALTDALRETDYTATIDWDKREVLFDVDAGDVEPSAKVSKVSKPAKAWEARIKDGLLSQVLARWCRESSGECDRFVNQSSHDLVIEGEMVATGDFKSAVDQLMMSVSDQVGRVFRWRLAPNKVLVLSDESAER